LLTLAGFNPYLFYKLYPAVITGFISLLSAMIAFKLTRSRAAALISATVTVFNPWILGQTYQVHRHVLGLTVLMLYFYATLPNHRLRTLWKMPALLLMAMSYELTCLLALVVSLIEVIRSKGYAKIAYLTSLSVSALLLLFYVGYPFKPVVALSTAGLSVAGGARVVTGLKYSVICLLMLAPFSPALITLRKVDTTVKVAIVLMFVFSLSYNISTITVSIPNRWFLMLMTVITPYAVASLYSRDNRSLLAILTVITLLAGVAYAFTNSGYQHFTLWYGIEPDALAWGYPERLSPAVSDLTPFRDIAEVIAEKPMATIMRFSIYPCLHLYIRNFTSAINLQNIPSVLDVIELINVGHLNSVYVITSHNITEELKYALENVNETMKLAGVEEPWFKLENLKCLESLKTSQYTLYECRVEERPS